MKRKILIVVVIVVTVALLLFAAVMNYRSRKQTLASQPRTIVLQEDKPESAGNKSGNGAPAASDGPGVGDEMTDLRGKSAPPFTLVTLDGKRASLADYKGKAVLLNFWATWCAPCEVEMPWFVDFEKQYGPQGLQILGAIANDDAKKEDVTAFAQKMNLNYPILLDGDSIQKAYGNIDSLPTSFYIGRNGKIVEQSLGLISKDEVEANIKKALAAGAQ